ncbi:MAG: hypothetical protein VKP72_05290 [bacterium]|nr:hypothetical protein [bacterium]
MKAPLLARLACLAGLGFTLAGCTVQIPSGLLPIQPPVQPPIDVKPPSDLQPPVEPPIGTLPPQRVEFERDFETNTGLRGRTPDWIARNVVFARRSPGLSGSQGALEVALAPGARVGFLELRSELAGEHGGDRRVTFLRSAGGVATRPARLELAFSQDGGHSWEVAPAAAEPGEPVSVAVPEVSDLTEPVSVAVPGVSVGALAKAVPPAKCAPYLAGETVARSLPAGTLRLRFVIRGSSPVVLDDLVVAASLHPVPDCELPLPVCNMPLPVCDLPLPVEEAPLEPASARPED